MGGGGFSIARPLGVHGFKYAGREEANKRDQSINFTPPSDYYITRCRSQRSMSRFLIAYLLIEFMVERTLCCD